MALNPLTLDVNYGVAGRPFQATISGITAGQTVEVLNDGTPGFSVSNGRVYSEQLPSQNPVTVALRLTEPGIGSRDSRFQIAVDGIALGAAGLPSALGALGVISNPGSTSTKKFRAARARVRTKSGRGKILALGDSTTAGGTKQIGWPTRMVNRLNAAGVPAFSEDVTGHKLQATRAAYLIYDPRVDIGTWGYDGTRSSFGASPWRGNGTTEVFTHTPGVAVDTFVIRYLVGSGFGSSSIAIDGAAPTTGPATIAAGNAVTQWQTATVKAASLKVQALTITKAVTGAFFIGQIYAYDSTTPGFDIVNGGWPTSRSLDWATNTGAFSPIPTITYEAADLVILGLGINDWDNGVSLADHVNNMTAIVTAARAVSDVMMIIQPQTNPNRNPNDAVANQKLYVDALTRLATASGSMLFDVQARFGDFPTASVTGLMADDVHPNMLGYSDWGDGIADLLARI